MAIEIIDAGELFDLKTEALSKQLLAARLTGEAVLPRLVALTTAPDNPANRSYIRALYKEAGALDRAHLEGQEEPGIFEALSFRDERRMRDYVTEHNAEPGLGMLLLRPFGNEEAAKELGLLQAVSDFQDVDGQAAGLDDRGQTLHTPATVRTCLELVEEANKEHGGLAGITRAAVIGNGPAVGRRTAQELEARGIEVTTITHNQNQHLMKHLGNYDAVIAAAGGPGSVEIINPFYLWRAPDDTRPPIIVIDAGYAVGKGETKPQGNLDRLFRSENFRKTTSLVAKVAVLGAVGAGARVAIFENTFDLAALQRQAVPQTAAV